MERRTIKFRAWDLLERKWIDDLSNVTNPISKPGRVTELKCSEDVALMQFTGLHDKNGKEIYEGDIVEFGLEMPYGLVKEHGVMEFDPNRAQFGVWKETELNVPDHVIQRKPPEVIGNIYENPELLK